jgi:hypothetical protein
VKHERKEYGKLSDQSKEASSSGLMTSDDLTVLPADKRNHDSRLNTILKAGLLSWRTWHE